MPRTLKIKTIANIGYTAVAKAAEFGLSAIVSVILARHLSASDYGIVGFACIFIGFLSQFSDLGVGSAVIQRVKIEDNDLYTGFTIKLILGPVIFASALLLAPIARAFFDNGAVEAVIVVLSFNFLINSFIFIPNCLLTRELNYKKLLIPRIFSAVMGAVVSIVLALSGFRYWSVVFGSLCATLATAVTLNILKPVRIRFRLDQKTAAEYLHFGGNVFGSGFAVYVIFNVDNFIIGAMQGADKLGYYALAFTWGSMICGILYSTIHSVLFPTFSQIQNDRVRLKTGYLKVLEYISFLGVMVNIALFLIAQDFLFHILGHGTEKWLPALTVLRIFCLYGIIRALLEPVANIFLALGQTRILLKSAVITALLELALLYPAIRFMGIEGVAVMVTAAYAIQYVIYFPYLKKEIDLSYRELWLAIRPAILSAVVITIFMAVAAETLRTDSIIFLGIKVALIIFGFILLHGIMSKWGIVRELKTLIHHYRIGETENELPR